MMDFAGKIDLHMHSTVSDGTDTPAEILQRVKENGIRLFSLTDHDAVKGSREIMSLWQEGDPCFLCGAEFSCKDEEGKYHILGYGYDPDSEGVNSIVRLGHSYRIGKVKERLEFLKKEFGFAFPDFELQKLFAMDNPGKPHIGNLMVKYKYAETKEKAIKEFINRIHFETEYVRPEEAIAGILKSGGIPVLAHPSYGSGDELIIGDEMDKRLQKLIGFGLQGVEAFYSGFTARLRDEILGFAEKYDLYVTAGSDYHGKNKLIDLGDTGLDENTEMPEGMKRFLNDAKYLGRQD